MRNKDFPGLLSAAECAEVEEADPSRVRLLYLVSLRVPAVRRGFPGAGVPTPAPEVPAAVLALALDAGFAGGERGLPASARRWEPMWTLGCTLLRGGQERGRAGRGFGGCEADRAGEGRRYRGVRGSRAQVSGRRFSRGVPYNGGSRRGRGRVSGGVRESLSRLGAFQGGGTVRALDPRDSLERGKKQAKGGE